MAKGKKKGSKKSKKSRKKTGYKPKKNQTEFTIWNIIGLVAGILILIGIMLPWAYATIKVDTGNEVIEETVTFSWSGLTYTHNNSAIPITANAQSYFTGAAMILFIVGLITLLVATLGKYKTTIIMSLLTIAGLIFTWTTFIPQISAALNSGPGSGYFTLGIGYYMMFFGAFLALVAGFGKLMEEKEVTIFG